MKDDKIKLKDFSPQKVRDLIKGMKVPSYRGDQILDWVYRKKVQDFDEMTNLPLDLREKLKEEFRVTLLRLEEKLVSPRDGTVKYLFETLDGELLECAVMLQDYGNTVCVSSQIGCGLNCIFCASAQGGLVRNLSGGEMLDQVILGEKFLGRGDSIKNIVVMGMGEPLLNLGNLILFLKTANDPQGLGISYRNITVSTAGITPGIIELAREELPFTLAVSLHAPDDETRSRLMPVNRKYPLAGLMAACRKYVEMTGRRLTFEYILLSGINDSEEKAGQLAELLGGLLCHVNLIPANPGGGEGIQRPDRKRIHEFYQVIEAAHIPVTIRKERGEDIQGACGQLRRRKREVKGN